jgi:hypothetical protein
MERPKAYRHTGATSPCSVRRGFVFLKATAISSQEDSMNQRLRPLFVLALVVMIVSSATVRGAKPLPEQTAAVTFRCAATVPDSVCPDGAFISDGIRGDGLTYAARLDAAGELFLVLRHGAGRTVWMDFRNGVTASCPTCRRDFDTLFIDDIVVHTNVVDVSGAPAAGGLKGILVGASSNARLKVAFNRLNASGQTVQWAVRFNPTDYPESDFVTVRRLSANTWEVEAMPTDRALLASNIYRQRGTDQIEGPFVIPFKMIVVSPAP